MSRSFRLLLLLLVAICGGFSGVTEAQTRLPIIDGTPTTTSNFPYVGIVAVGNFMCTGTLVGERYVLTAAHCFYDLNNRRINDVNVMRVYLNGERFEVSKVTVHPTYVSRSAACVNGETDAAVIELASAPDIEPVVLQRSAPTEGTQILIAGFGTQGTGAGGEDGTIPSSGYINYGVTTIEYVDDDYVEWVFDANSGESNTASGDSGGPAFLYGDDTHVLNSITCGGAGNSGFGTVSANTRVDKLALWVDSVMGTTAPNTPPTFISLKPQTAGKGQYFYYQLQATGSAPLVFSVDGTLPPGLQLDGDTIAGIPIAAGRYNITVSAVNDAGSDTEPVQITVTDFNPDYALTLDAATVDFSRTATSLLTLKGKIELGKAFLPHKAVVRIVVDELKQSFRLNELGTNKKRGGKDYFTLKGKLKKNRFTASKVSFTAGVGDSLDLYNKLDSLFPIVPKSGEIVSLPVEITIEGVTYRRTVKLRYNLTKDLWQKT